MQIIGTVLFGLAVLHTFLTPFFESLAQTYPRHAGIWHLLGEVEVVFGFWAMLLMVAMLVVVGKQQAVAYLDTRNFTEPMFVFASMVIAGTRPILYFAGSVVQWVAKFLPFHRGLAVYFVLLSFVPLLGSLVTEPAAMTLAALMLRDKVFAPKEVNPLTAPLSPPLSPPLSIPFQYTTLGVLFVNVSIGGTLTPFAAPPVLMVASQWGWDVGFMLTTFGWKAAIAVVINAAAATFLFRRELRILGSLGSATTHTDGVGDACTPKVPVSVVVVHGLFLVGVVVFAHHPPVFIGLLLFFLGFTTAYQRHQSPLILREALLVAFFLAGLVVLGGLQQWWLQPLLLGMDATTVFWGATALTAVTDNAALTYLGSLVEGLSPEFQTSLVAGAVTGGGLTVIANAPNPAGASILKGHFENHTILPLYLLMGALPPTMVAWLMFRF